MMARVAAARMNFERAHTLLERAENHGIARDWGRLSAAAIAEQARLYLNDGRWMKAPHASIAWSDLHESTRRPGFAPGRKFNGTTN